MTTSKSTQPTARKRIVIKLGGSMLEGLNEDFFTNFKQLQKNGHEVIIVHGGGPFINKALARNNVVSSVVNGIRVTSKEAVEIVQSTLPRRQGGCRSTAWSSTAGPRMASSVWGGRSKPRAAGPPRASTLPGAWPRSPLVPGLQGLVRRRAGDPRAAARRRAQGGSPRRADVAVVNTCCVTNEAVAKSRQAAARPRGRTSASTSRAAPPT